MHNIFQEDVFSIDELAEYKNKYSDLISVISNINKRKSASPLWNELEDPQLTIDYPNELNSEQLSAVTNINGPLLIVAGAGSGKTRTLTYRVAYMIEKGIDPESILLLTFTKKAATEMMNRVQALLKNKRKSNVAGGTFHSFANLSIRRYAPSIGLNPGFSILDNIDSGDLIGIVKKDLKLKKTEYGAYPRKGTIYSAISKARNLYISIHKVLEKYYPEIIDFSEDIEKLFSEYTKYKNLHNQFDYDDLLFVLLDKLRNYEGFRNLLQSKYRYIMVDEYQDTNIVQKEIVNIIASKNRNIMVVGDDAQSVYRFRAADLRNILSFPKDYPDLSYVKLEQNYRSKQDILNFTNCIIENFMIGYRKNLRSSNYRKGIPEIYKFSSSDSEASWISQKIIELKNVGEKLNSIAVLYRATYHSNYLQTELMKRNLNFVVYGGLRFTDRKHIKDILAYLKVIQNPYDNISWNRILRHLPTVGNVRAAKIIRNIQSTVNDSLPNRSKRLIAYESYLGQAFYEEIKVLSDVLFEVNAPSISIANKIEVLREYYKTIISKIDSDYEVRLIDIQVLVNIAEKYRGLNKFLSSFILEPPSNKHNNSLQPAEGDSKERLVLSTVHSAKGLEWKYVFVMGLLDGMFPSKKSLDSIEDIEEERRLFYVACTRAKDELFLTLPEGQGTFGTYYSNPSRFLKEIQEEMYTYYAEDSYQEEEGVF